MRRRLAGKVYFGMLAVSLTGPLSAQYDESKVPKYTLPDPLTLLNGKKVTDSQTWKSAGRR